jgi:hypothetical protein
MRSMKGILKNFLKINSLDFFELLNDYRMAHSLY